ncbi:hypothetical protein JXA34_00020 [Patescibacteria group bacterium]|nr:hypothetical protein [Patescibacteria group bacterium]
MSHTETVTGKIPEEHKEILQKHGVNISKLIRNAVEREIQRIKEEEQMKALEEAMLTLQKIPDEEITQTIRKTRDAR